MRYKESDPSVRMSSRMEQVGSKSRKTIVNSQFWKTTLEQKRKDETGKNAPYSKMGGDTLDNPTAGSTGGVRRGWAKDRQQPTTPPSADRGRDYAWGAPHLRPHGKPGRGCV